MLLVANGLTNELFLNGKSAKDMAENRFTIWTRAAG